MTVAWNSMTPANMMLTASAAYRFEEAHAMHTQVKGCLDIFVCVGHDKSYARMCACQSMSFREEKWK